MTPHRPRNVKPPPPWSKRGRIYAELKRRREATVSELAEATKIRRCYVQTQLWWMRERGLAWVVGTDRPVEGRWGQKVWVATVCRRSA